MSNALNDFAAAVLARCATVAEGEYRLGRKVFVAALNPSKLTRRMLVEAHRAGLLTLARCDLTEAFSREIQAVSECSYMNATWHFVVLP